MIDIQPMADYSCRPCRLVWLGDQECPFCGQPGDDLDGTPLDTVNEMAAAHEESTRAPKEERR